MARTDGDTWDLASSVGATATMVAAARAMASRADSPTDQRPVRRAAGASRRAWTCSPGWPAASWTPPTSSDDSDGPTSVGGAMSADGRQHGGAHQVLRRVLPGRDQGGHQAGGDPGVGAGFPRLPAAVARRHRGLRDRPAAGHRIQDPHPGRAGCRSPPPTDARWPSICATTGPPRCAPPASTRPSRRAWSAEGLLGYLPPEAQDRLLDTITELSAPGSRLATESAPNPEPGDEEQDQRAHADASPSAGVHTVSIST